MPCEVTDAQRPVVEQATLPARRSGLRPRRTASSISRAGDALMVVLTERPGPLDLVDLTAYTGLSLGTLRDEITTLERLGLVRRSLGPDGSERYSPLAR